MKIAAFMHKHGSGLGVVSADSTSIHPFELDSQARQDGLLGLIAWLGSGGVLPATGAPIALGEVQLQAPFNRMRRNL